MNIFTTKGILDTSDLTVEDIIVMEGNARTTATEWYLGDELVRRDVHVNILTGQDLFGEQG